MKKENKCTYVSRVLTGAVFLCLDFSFEVCTHNLSHGTYVIPTFDLKQLCIHACACVRTYLCVCFPPR